MINLATIGKSHIATLPEVVALVVSDKQGTPLESTGDIDADAIAAVYAVVVAGISRAGEQLGLGQLSQATIGGRSKSCVVRVQGETIVAVHVDGDKPISGVERKLEMALRRQATTGGK